LRLSPTGLNIAAQGKAKRRPGYVTARNAHCPEGAEQTVPTHTIDPKVLPLQGNLALADTVPRAALRSALGYNVAAPFGANR